MNTRELRQRDAKVETSLPGMKKKIPVSKPTLPLDLSTEALAKVEASAKAGQPPQPTQSDKAHKPVIPFVFKKPPMASTFSKGSAIRQDNRGRFFARTRRGGI